MTYRNQLGSKHRLPPVRPDRRVQVVSVKATQVEAQADRWAANAARRRSKLEAEAAAAFEVRKAKRAALAAAEGTS